MKRECLESFVQRTNNPISFLPSQFLPALPFVLLSAGDTMSMLNKDHLDRATVLWATTVYSVANLNDILPRTGDHPSPATSHALTLTLSLASLGLTLIPSLAAAALIFRLN